MITVAKNAGFCFGVRRATDTVEKLIKEKKENEIICTFGKLIHNEEYNKFLEKNGVIELTNANIGEIFDKTRNGYKVTVVIRTHGVEKEIQKSLEDYASKTSNLVIVDSTCPYVKKIHKIANENSSNGETFIVIGQKEHPEVKSIISYVNNDCHVFFDEKELEAFLEANKDKLGNVNMAAQTTLKLTLWEKCQKILKKYCTNAKIFDTICSVTEARQTEAMELAKKSDAILVIGGKGYVCL